MLNFMLKHAKVDWKFKLIQTQRANVHTTKCRAYKDQENRIMQNKEYGEDQKSRTTQQLLKINMIDSYGGDIPMSQ